MGRLAKASNNFSAAIGDTAEAKGISSYAFGRNTYTNNWANAFGAQAKAKGRFLLLLVGMPKLMVCVHKQLARKQKCTVIVH